MLCPLVFETLPFMTYIKIFNSSTDACAKCQIIVLLFTLLLYCCKTSTFNLFIVVIVPSSWRPKGQLVAHLHEHKLSVNKYDQYLLFVSFLKVID